MYFLCSTGTSLYLPKAAQWILKALPLRRLSSGPASYHITAASAVSCPPPPSHQWGVGIGDATSALSPPSLLCQQTRVLLPAVGPHPQTQQTRLLFPAVGPHPQTGHGPCLVGGKIFTYGSTIGVIAMTLGWSASHGSHKFSIHVQ